MKPGALRMLPLLLALPLVAAPLVSAAVGEGTKLEAASPVTLEGRADTWLPGGTASFVGSGATQPIALRLVADRATLYLHTAVNFCGMGFPGVPGAPPSGCEGYEEDVDVFPLTDVTIVALKATSAYKIVATTDREHADSSDFGEDGRLLATTGPTTQLATNRESIHLTASDEAWVGDDEDLKLAESPVYAAPAGSSEVGSSAAALIATGGFETFLQGLQIKITGTDEKGEAFETTLDTRYPASEQEPFEYLVVESSGGELGATSSAPFLAYAPVDQRPVTDVRTRASFASATGTLVEDGNTRAPNGEDLRLSGPLSLRLVGIRDGATPRLTYAITPGLQLAEIVDDPSDEPMDPAMLAAAGAAGAGGAGALIALLYFWPRLKYALTLALLPLYTRIERSAVLEHEKRDELYELIRSAPGIHAHEIGTKANIGWGTTVYHLKLLENHGLIVSKKSGRYKRFFVNTGEYTKKKDIYGALRNQTAKSIADFIVTHPGTTQKELCAAVGIQPSLASWHVEKLEGVELVKRVKDGRMVRYFAGPAWQQIGTPVPPVPAGDVEGGAAS